MKKKTFSLDIALYASYFCTRKNDKLIVPGLATRDKEHCWLCLFNQGVFILHYDHDASPSGAKLDKIS